MRFHRIPVVWREPSNLCIAAVAAMFWLLTACNSGSAAHVPNGGAQPKGEDSVSNSAIPSDTLKASDVAVVNGVYLRGGKPFSGYVVGIDPEEGIHTVLALRQGVRDGISQSFWRNGKLRDRRAYRAGKSEGQHEGWWLNGHRQFLYHYRADRREGLFQRWYDNGQAYLTLHYAADAEEGLQQGWRENGKLFINYEARGGRRYGLQRSALCYTLLDEKLAQP